MFQANAFQHHPELAGSIVDPHKSFFRTITTRSLLDQNPKLEAFRDWVHTDEVRETNRKSFLEQFGQGDLWIFAYGSLMWDPALDFAEVRRAYASEHERKFILLDEKGARGTKEAPGLMAALDHGKGCEGLAFRVHAQDVDRETQILWQREMIGPGYLPTLVSAQMGGQQVQVLTFLADLSNDAMCDTLTREQQVQYIATGSGFLGSSKAYLENIVVQFEKLGIPDADCVALLQETEAYIAQNGISNV